MFRTAVALFATRDCTAGATAADIGREVVREDAKPCEVPGAVVVTLAPDGADATVGVLGIVTGRDEGKLWLALRVDWNTLDVDGDDRVELKDEEDRDELKDEEDRDELNPPLLPPRENDVVAVATKSSMAAKTARKCRERLMTVTPFLCTVRGTPPT